MKLPAFQLVGFEYKGQATSLNVPKLWENFLPRRQDIKNSTGPECYGYIGHVPEGMHYLAGLKVTNVTEAPAGMKMIKVPEQTYAVFTHRGPVLDVGKSFDEIFARGLKDAGVKPAQGPSLEYYDERFDGGSASSEFDLLVPIRND